MPPEVVVPAPENSRETFTAEAIREMPRVMTALIEQATRDAKAERDRERVACPWCRTGGEPGKGSCRCRYRCGYGGCCSSGNPGRFVFDRLVDEEVAA
jgi:hypothetical protein